MSNLSLYAQHTATFLSIAKQVHLKTFRSSFSFHFFFSEYSSTNPKKMISSRLSILECTAVAVSLDF